MVQIIKPNHTFKLKPHLFSRKLMQWNNQKNDRQMPWKGIKDPYKIWLSEIILQQTRVEQGLAYYNRFIQTYPTVHDLAKAPSEEVFKLWEGLGYYSRCRNLLASATYISHDLKGAFPKTYAEILKLKGIGPYTAAAIGSFAFGLPYAVVDGNVARVLARVFGVEVPFDSAGSKFIFQQLAQLLLDTKDPGLYNQAIMDFGATICKPASPLCNQCPFKKECFAFNHDLVYAFPLKKKKIIIKKRHFTYFLVNKGKKIALAKREKKDIWRHLFEFYLLETNSNLPENHLIRLFCQENDMDESMFDIIKCSPVFSQQLTHQHISCRFIEMNIHQKMKNLNGFICINRRDLPNYPFPRIINQYLESL